MLKILFVQLKCLYFPYSVHVAHTTVQYILHNKLPFLCHYHFPHLTKIVRKCSLIHSYVQGSIPFILIAAILTVLLSCFHFVLTCFSPSCHFSLSTSNNLFQKMCFILGWNSKDFWVWSSSYPVGKGEINEAIWNEIYA